jgi:hypothetical protein
LDAAQDPPAVVAPAPVANPEQAAPPTHAIAATDYYGRTEHERALCMRAASPSWGYIALLVNANVVAAGVHVATKYAPDTGVRMLGPGFVGLAWGALIGGGYLAMPKCHNQFAGGAPPEGDVHSSLPLALGLATLAGATAPVLMGIEMGPLVQSWTTEERVMRLVTAGLAGFAGALLPYIPFLAPPTWRAAKELERLRIAPLERGAWVGYSARF